MSTTRNFNLALNLTRTLILPLTLTTRTLTLILPLTLTLTLTLTRLEREFRGADFFKVNFKAQSELSYNERVFSFPTVHFYLPGIGRVGRCVLTAKEAEPRLRAGLARFLGGSEGAPRQLQLLQELRTEVLRPIVRYKDLVCALRGLADVQALSAAPPNSAMAGLRDAVERDEERL